MSDFYSKELDRTFDKVLFLETLFTGDASASAEDQVMTPGSRVIEVRSDVKVKAEKGAISMSELYADPAIFNGKRVRVTGEVTKFNPSIMDRNWVHLQDGTEHEGKFDLTATSQESFKVGEQVTIEGILAVDQDFGYGYSYEILLEAAVRVK